MLAKRTIFFEEYAKHATLNFGQALQGIRYFYSHSDCDDAAARGTLAHVVSSLSLRAKRSANDLFFAVIPPHWHHTADELHAMRTVPVRRWFLYGYCAWRFDESGEPRSDLDGTEDRRWDPRCRAAQK